MIYFIRRLSDKAIKIGTSYVPLHRFQQLTREHGKLTFLGWCPGGLEIESALHKMFADSHLEFEWFTESARLMAFIENNCCKTHPRDFEETLFYILQQGSTWSAFQDNQRLLEENKQLDWKTTMVIKQMAETVEHLKTVEASLDRLHNHLAPLEKDKIVNDIIRVARREIHRLGKIIHGTIERCEDLPNFHDIREYWYKRLKIEIPEREPIQPMLLDADRSSRFSSGSRFRKLKRGK